MEHLEVARIMRERIIDGGWTAGRKILPEEDLALIFNVSRQTIREAIANLLQDGYLETRPNKGVYVRFMTSNELAELLTTDTGRLGQLSERIRNVAVTADDLGLIAEYLAVLAEHGHTVATRALRTIDDAPPSHPVRSTDDGGDAQVYLDHAGELFQAIETFTANITRRKSHPRPPH